MKSLIGISNSNPWNVSRLILDLKDSMKFKIHLLEVGGSVKKADVAIVLSLSDLVRVRQDLTKYKVVFVFGSPMMLSRVKEIDILDARRVDGQTFKFKTRPINKSMVKKVIEKGMSGSKIKTISISPAQVIPAILKTMTGSYISKILTYSHTTKSDRQSRNKALYTWINDGAELSAFPDKTRSGKKLLEFFVTDEGSSFLLAIRTAVEQKKQGRSIAYSAISKDTGIDTFDIKYVMTNLKSFSASEEENDRTMIEIHRENRKKAKDKEEAKNVGRG